MSNLLPFAIRVLKEHSTGQRKLICNHFYYLVQGFLIEKNGNDEVKICVEDYRLGEDKLYDGYISEQNDKFQTDISISAIVGANGSGKSTLVELLLRIINNFAASTIGEKFVYSSAEHLHYINGVNAELYYLKNHIPYRLRVQERNVTLQRFGSNGSRDSYRNLIFIPEGEPFDNGGSIIRDVALQDSPMDSWSPTPDEKVSHGNRFSKIYEPLFYTYVSNYSIYAYNPNDYADECNSNEYENKIRHGKKGAKYNVQDRCWLKGLFHKNDGYQTPIVLTPMRNSGDIDINNENKLARERLVSILINPSPNNNFNIINGHLEVHGFNLKLVKQDFSPHALNHKLGFQRMQGRGYEQMRNIIVSYWKQKIGKEFKDNLHHYDEAVSYLTYKTIKISHNYAQYRPFYNNHFKASYKIDGGMLKHLIDGLAVDHSHITRKIRSTLAYLVYGYCETSIDDGQAVTLPEIREQAQPILGDSTFINTIEELAPPPFYEAQLIISEKGYEDYQIPFNTLSSGERQIAYSISNILYHLVNLESVWEDDNDSRIKYDSVNVILEEIELYFHPDLQRKLIKSLLDGIDQCLFSNIKSIHIFIITHSPFVLSDIPNKNILTLSSDSNTDGNTNLPSFGANIHEMLHHQFFLKDGAIGEFAKWKIGEIIKKLDSYRNPRSIQEKTDLKNEAERIHRDISIIDEPIIKQALMDDYYTVINRIFGREQQINDIDQQIARLQAEKQRLCGN